MRKIHITEAQFECIKKSINETDIAVDPKPGQDLDQAVRDAKRGAQQDIGGSVTASDKDINYHISGDDPTVKNMEEGRTYTKKQVSEERVRNLKKQCVRITKKSLR